MDMSKMLRDLQKMQSKMMKAQSDLKAQSFEAEAGGGMVKIAMNGKYLLDALKALTSETVVMSFNTSISPFILENAEEGGSQYLILPVRTSSVN